MNELSKKQVSVYMLPRHTIESGDLKPFLEKLNNNEGSFDAPFHLVIDGYNKDHRELHEIPAVKRYFKRVCKRYTNWLKPTISLDTIRLIVQILLVKKTTCPEGDFSEAIRHLYLKEGDWSKLINEWVRKSPLGLDYASHLAFEAFPSMCKVEGFQTKDPSLNLLKDMLETGYPISQKILTSGKGAVKVYSFQTDTIELRLYYKHNGENTTHKKNLALPNLESEESTLLFKDQFQSWIESIVGDS